MGEDLGLSASAEYGRIIHRARERSSASYERYVSFFRVYLLPLLPQDRSARILDVGCGDGHLLHALAACGFSASLGVEKAPQQVEAARRRGLRVEQADAFEFLRSRPASFDAVVGVDLVEHLDRDRCFELLALTRDSLRPGGRAVFHTTNAWSPFSRRFFYGDVTHEHCYSPKSLADMAELAGLRPQRAWASSPEREWRRRGPIFLKAFWCAQSLAWWVLSRSCMAAEMVATRDLPVVYTPNFILVCAKE